MKIIPLRGLSIKGVHAPQGVPVEVSDEKLARELIGLRVADLAPEPAAEPVPEPVVETAVVAPSPAVETAALKRNRRK